MNSTGEEEGKFDRSNVNSLRPSDVYMSINYPTIGSYNGLSPIRRQAIIWTNSGILLIRNLGTNFNEILGKIHTFSLGVILYRPQCVSNNIDINPWEYVTNK